VNFIDIEQLRLFISVAEHLSFTKAAKHFYIAQPALSRRIAELERQLGIKLFDRNKQLVRLTPAGLVLLEESKEIIAKADEAIERVRRADSGITGSLKIGFLASLVKKFLSQCVKVFRQKHPNIDLSLNQYNMAPLHEALEHGDLDIGFTMSFDIQGSPDLAFKKIYSDSISLVIHKDHPLYEKSDINLSMVSREPFVMLSQQESPRWFKIIMRMCAKKGFFPNIVASPPLLSTVLILTDAGIGVTIVPSWSKNYGIQNLRFIKLDEEETNIDVVVAWKKATLNPSVEVFLY